MKALLQSEKARFIVAGAWNTAIGYVVFVVLYALLGDLLRYGGVLVLTYVLNITNAFFVLKLFVFRSRGSWIAEYARTYVAYAAVFALNAALLTMLVEATPLDAVPAQALAVLIAAVASYALHKYFTFGAAIPRSSD